MKHVGDRFERMAGKWLANRGFRLIYRNFRCKAGELDIIALDHGVVVFVEVRARTRSRYAGAAASVDTRKQARLIRASQLFLQQHPQWSKHPCRFDVITYDQPQSGADIAPRWIRGAFTL